MLAPVLVLAVAAAVGATTAGGLPFFSLPTLDIGIPLQPFGIIVATGVLIGAELLRRYAFRHNMEDDDIRSLTMWVIVTGFIGAHVLDILMYEQDRLADEGPILLLKLWDGISSWGGFVGGALGFAFWVWWKRATPGLLADTTAVGLLPAFSIGRIGCTIVHDHVGRATTSALGVDYPKSELVVRGIYDEFATRELVVRAHNLGMYELAYLIPVNVVILWLAFQRTRRLPAGFLAVLTGLLYAPVRFLLEFWRLDTSDPRYVGFTFAQWGSAVAMAVAAYGAWWLWKYGTPAPTPEELGKRPGGRKASLVALAAARVKAGGDAVGDDGAGKKGAKARKGKR
ncbi:MAG: prolipoprotein diacylglyceryl transferase [Kofleriaceae bacterium]|nr:prolipoprotein diacylglyceryl transferase [Kofleriaceae bacterium]MCL4227816.1 prolipoprotein diacylglyceryl transferase [Myxococcales bacterium]